MQGPSTNFYVGPEEKHYTIPKRLLYHFSDYGRLCLEGPFVEAGMNATWLRDVDPTIFQWLWHWLYTGKLKVYQKWDVETAEKRERACRILCELHILGERLLFDHRFLDRGVKWKLEKLTDKAKSLGATTPLTPQIVEIVLSGSTPVEEDEFVCTSGGFSLRPFVLRQLCNFDFCTKTDFIKWTRCFELDGAFAAELMVFMADELRWAVRLWEKQGGWGFGVAEIKQRFGKVHHDTELQESKRRKRQGAWRALKVMCTSAGCTTADLREYSNVFEMDGAFAAEVLGYLAKELLRAVEWWGDDRGSKVDVVFEKEEEEWVAEEEESRERYVQKIMRRNGWS